jgi:hypothetical protein
MTDRARPSPTRYSVDHVWRWLLLGMVLAAASACAGSAGDFVRPQPQDFTPGRTTAAEIVSRFGSPKERGRTVQGGVEVSSLSYSHADPGARSSAAGVPAARAVAFYFVRDTLVGYEAISTFAADSSDFDDTRVSDIRRGITDEAELGDLVGRPSGTYIYPLAPAPGERVLVYSYAQKRGKAPLARKQLLITLDARGIVREVQFEKTGDW